MDQIVYNIPGLHFQEIDNEEDLLFLSRQDYKFLIPRHHLEEILIFLSEDFFCKQYNGVAVFKYHNTYFDTDNFTFFNQHRQGKFSRIKIRLRDYKNGRESKYIECKRKERGFLTNKFRQRVENQGSYAEILASDMVKESLKNYNLSPNDLTQCIFTSYDRISLRAKHELMRISIDFNLKASRPDQEDLPILSDYMILEIKSNKYPKKVITFLKSRFGIRETNFSKYCISVCKLEKKVKANKWKQILKHDPSF